ncbi:MAG TPA: glycosyltransferase 87 family protein, partial [Stellaceae bacterium]|nr:glycosyltransferase 87 family protein [Stellaceae bacterium]
VMTGFDLVTIWAILLLLRRRRLPESWALIYAWNPLPVFEFSGSGHIDAAAISLMMLACLFADRRRPALAGAILGAATLVKYFPAVVLPALYSRWDRRLPLAMLAAVVLLYIPYLSVGMGVLGFLPGYAHEEGLTHAGSGFFLLAALGQAVTLPPWASHAYLLAGLAALAILGLAALLRPSKDGIALGSGLALVLAFTLILSPHLDWYFAWVLPFACLHPRASLLYLAGASPLLYGIVWPADRLALEATIYLPFAILLLLETLRHKPVPAMEAFNGNRLDAPAD